MNITYSKTATRVRTMVIDALLLGVICTVPTLSHLFAIPFYKLNPMLLCLLASMLLVSDRRNAYLMAVLLPSVSMLVSGMPLPLNALCMSAELLAVVALLQLVEKKAPTFVAAVAAIVGGKIVYYALKALIVAPATLIGTSLWLQAGTVVVFAALYSLIRNR